MVIDKVSAEGSIWTQVEEGKRLWSKHSPLWGDGTGILLENSPGSLPVPQIVRSQSTAMHSITNMSIVAGLFKLFVINAKTVTVFSAARIWKAFTIWKAVWCVYLSGVHVTNWWTLDKALTRALVGDDKLKSKSTEHSFRCQTAGFQGSDSNTMQEQITLTLFSTKD